MNGTEPTLMSEDSDISSEQEIKSGSASSFEVKFKFVNNVLEFEGPLPSKAVF